MLCVRMVVKSLAWLRTNERTNVEKETNKQTFCRQNITLWKSFSQADWLSFVYLCVGSHHRLKWDRFLCFVFLHGDWTEKYEIQRWKLRYKKAKGRQKEVKRSWYKNLRRLQLKGKRKSAMFSNTKDRCLCLQRDVMWWWEIMMISFRANSLQLTKRNIFMERFSFSGSI